MTEYVPLVMHPGHDITVTEGAFGRGYVDCSCGLLRVLSSKPAAVRSGLHHHHDVGGCNCPPEVVAHERHPDFPSASAGGSAVTTSG